MAFSEESLDRIRQDILNSLPKSAEISDVQFEGPEISIYSSSEKFIGDDREIIKNLVKKLRKRIVVRSDPSIRLDNDETVEYIKSAIPEDAEVSKIMFNENLGEVIIEARKPGVAIGKSGTNIKQIILDQVLILCFHRVRHQR